MRLVVVTALVALLSPSLARAQEAPAQDDGLRVVHGAPSVSVAGAPVELRFELVHPERVAGLVVRWRPAGSRDPWREVVARRDDAGGWYAALPEQPADVPAVRYHVVVTTPAFASAESPHAVLLQPDEATRDELDDLARSRGQRLTFSAYGEYTTFGAQPGAACGRADGRCPDWWYRTHGAVRYSFFRAVRAVSVSVERLGGETTRHDAGVARTTSVGLVAATTELEFRLAPSFGFAASAILGANEQRVQGGGGARLLFGLDGPMQLTFGVEGVVNYGVLLSGWMRWRITERFPAGAGVEVTNQPGDDRWGSRLLVEAGVRVGRHVTVRARGGFAARTLDAFGFSAGLGVDLAL